MGKKEVNEMLANGTLLSNLANEDNKTESENIAEIIKEWLNTAYIHLKTRLNANQIVALTILKTLSTKYHIKCIADLIDNFVMYKLSENGQSSKELVDILKSRSQIENDENFEQLIKPFIQ